MTKQELIQKLKDLSVTENSRQEAIPTVVSYVMSNESEIKYWFDKCMDSKVVSSEEEIKEEKKSFFSFT